MTATSATRHLCLHEVRPHHLCTLRLNHKGTCLAVPRIPKGGAA